jgi:hypothetical protein
MWGHAGSPEMSKSHLLLAVVHESEFYGDQVPENVSGDGSYPFQYCGIAFDVPEKVATKNPFLPKDVSYLPTIGLNRIIYGSSGNTTRSVGNKHRIGVCSLENKLI